MLRPPKKKKLQECLLERTHECDDGNSLQEWNPGKVLEHRVPKATLAETILKEGEAEVTEHGKDSHTREPYFERMQIVPVDVCGPSEEEVVHEGKRDARRDTVSNRFREFRKTTKSWGETLTVGEHVRCHADFVMYWSVGPHENV